MIPVRVGTGACLGGVPIDCYSNYHASMRTGNWSAQHVRRSGDVRAYHLQSGAGPPASKLRFQPRSCQPRLIVAVSPQALDLAAWLAGHVRAADYVAVVMDLEGREFGVLAHLLDSGALALIDRLYIHWHLQHLVRPLAGWPAALVSGSGLGSDCVRCRIREMAAIAGPRRLVSSLLQWRAIQVRLKTGYNALRGPADGSLALLQCPAFAKGILCAWHLNYLLRVSMTP